MRILILMCGLVVGLVGAAAQAENPTYDLIFRTGTLDDVPRSDTLVYIKTVQLAADRDAAENDSGEVRLSFEEGAVARLKFHKGERHRNIGAFPADIGNPMIMYFVETVIRDVAAQAEGSPFYIRNRVKDSLVAFAEIEALTVAHGGSDLAVQGITLRPFLNDKNRDKMKGYEDLALTITMSDEVPGWYQSLTATVPGDGGPLYETTLTLVAEGDGQ